MAIHSSVPICMGMSRSPRKGGPRTTLPTTASLGIRRDLPAERILLGNDMRLARGAGTPYARAITHRVLQIIGSISRVSELTAVVLSEGCE